jgi:excisionase family DNA binding protein
MSAHADHADRLGRHPDVSIENRQTAATADDVLTVDDVATLFHLPRRTVAEYGARGVLPSVKIGRHRRFSRRQLETVMANGRARANG